MCQIGVLKSFTKFTGKHLYQNLFFNKTAAFQPATLSKTKLCSGEYSKKATFSAMINEKKQLPQSLLTRK